MKILMTIPAREARGGPPGHLPLLVKGLRSQGITVYENLYGNRLVHPGIIDRLKFFTQGIRGLRYCLSQEEITLIHINTAFDLRALARDLLTILSIKPYRRHIFIKFHGSDETFLFSKNPFCRLLIYKMTQWADAFGVLSTEERNNFLKVGFPKDRLFVVKNILQPDIYRADPSFRKKWGIDDYTPILLFVARFVQSKGLISLIRACRIVIEKGYDFKLLCVGDGPVRKQAELETEKLNLNQKIIFLGYIPESKMKEFYPNATMLVFPTKREGFSMAIFQSVAAGLPIITTRIRAAADYLQEPINCLWTEPDNPEQLAEKICQLLRNKELLENMILNNRRLAEKFVIQEVTNEFIKIYRKMLNNG